MSGSIKADMLNAHNEYRKKHGAASLKWNSKLASEAQRWAEKCAEAGSLMHDDGDFGENVAAASGKDLSGRDAVDMWYSEIKDYDFSKPGRQPNTGHFTQVVWLDSEELGAGKAKASNGSVFIVARYLPAGNIISKVAENVKPAGSKAPATNSRCVIL